MPHLPTLLWSFTTIFQILSGENWNANMYDGWRAAGPIAVLYYVSLITLGMFIVMNLFMAILLSNFGSDKLHGDEAEEAEEQLHAVGVALGGEKDDGALPECARDEAEQDRFALMLLVRPQAHELLLQGLRDVERRVDFELQGLVEREVGEVRNGR